jgi:RHH-type rel operon transcriptional repressor/antitoxin RelB
MNMVALRLPEDITHKLNMFAKQFHRSKSFLIRKAIETYLRDSIDYQIALDRLNDKDDPIISSKEMRSMLGK